LNQKTLAAALEIHPEEEATLINNLESVVGDLGLTERCEQKCDDELLDNIVEFQLGSDSPDPASRSLSDSMALTPNRGFSKRSSTIRGREHTECVVLLRKKLAWYASSLDRYTKSLDEERGKRIELKEAIAAHVKVPADSTREERRKLRRSTSEKLSFQT
jgi:hypothetical protein